jgi:MFS family permease
MKQASTLFLKATIVVMGLAVLALCIFALPAGIMSDNTGYYRPLLMGMYLPAIPFFIALYQALLLLKYIDKNSAFSELSVKALKNIKYCGAVIGSLYALGMPYIFTVADKDDAPGVVLIGLIIIGASIVVAVFAAILQKLVKNAIDIKTENDLTV